MKRGIIIATVLVIPVLVLGVRSFQRERRAIAGKLPVDLVARTREAVEAAFMDRTHTVARFHFEMEDGVVVRPAMHASLPETLPPSFVEPDRQEADRPDLALATYRRILASGERESLALAGIARSLTALGRSDEARAIWRKVAADFPDDRDPLHRPYGILGAIKAGDTDGLFDKIVSGRWELDREQTRDFLMNLDPGRAAPYLEQFTFAEALEAHFKPQSPLVDNEIYEYTFPGYRIFYKSDGPDRVKGFAVDEDWVTRTLRRGERNVSESTR